MSVWLALVVAVAIAIGAGIGAYLGVLVFFLVDLRQRRQAMAEAEASLDQVNTDLDAVEQALGDGA